MSESLSNSEQIFHEALQMPHEDQAAFVKQACDGDSQRIAELEFLLAAHHQSEADDFMLSRPGAESDPNDFADIAESEGDHIGRYRLLELIGEGGMGLVYMAEQTEGVRRRVAVKIIKLGMDTRQFIARFEAERQAMALFDHPNITRVLDVGSTSTGRPYFVMELVRGVGITDYVRTNELPLPERLALFTTVCRAVHHAHQKSVIHRDLKPSNILVTQFDGVPVPKVIDFGIAKAIGQQSLTERTLFTRFGSMVGTPQYMSPEQAEMTGLDIDTRADIYSLGVILYELITGSTPLESRELKQLNPIALYETLRDANIETPSLRLSRLQRSADSATSAPSIAKPVTIPPERLKGGLDWIVMKAIARDRRERYESSAALAADVDRLLAGDPVEAAPPSKMYLLRTMLRKYRAAAFSVVTVVSLLLASATICSILAFTNYRTSQRLAESNTELSQTVVQLRTAEETIRTKALADQYQSAISISFMRFDIELMQLASKQFSARPIQMPPPNKDEIEKDEIEAGKTGPLPNALNMSSFQFVAPSHLGDEYAAVLNLSQSKLLESALQPIKMWLSNNECHMVDVQMFPDPNEPGILEANLQTNDPRPVAQNAKPKSQMLPSNESLPLDFDADFVEQMERERSDLAQKERDRFYRHLVKEYRRIFGDRNARVAESLNLLAACLMEIGETDEAEARLRESIGLAEEHDKEVAQKLLNILSEGTLKRSKPGQ